MHLVPSMLLSLHSILPQIRIVLVITCTGAPVPPPVAAAAKLANQHANLTVVWAQQYLTESQEASPGIVRLSLPQKATLQAERLADLTRGESDGAALNRPLFLSFVGRLHKSSVSGLRLEPVTERFCGIAGLLVRCCVLRPLCG